MLNISKKEARQWALTTQGLLGNPSKEKTQTWIEKLGYIQIDSISVIERAHHHVLWSRNHNYSPDELNSLLKSQAVFEYWGHAASYLPLRDYPYYLPTMQSFVTRSKWATSRMESYGHLIPEVLARIKVEGPLKASDFKSVQKQKGGWWNWKPAKVVLELLYWRGDLMVCQRDKIQKVYDLKERFLPPDLLNAKIPSREEIGQFCIQRALSAHGLMTFREISKHLPLCSRKELKVGIEIACENKSIHPLNIEKMDETYYALSGQIECLPKSQRNSSVAHILSPFDNTVIQRERLRKLFDFNYIFEAYVPKVKRIYGYFSLPILYQDQFIGCCDLKAERKEKNLKVLSLYWSGRVSEAQKQAFVKTLKTFAQFNGCLNITLSQVKTEPLEDISNYLAMG